MTTTAHFWAIGYDKMGRADEVRDEFVRLGKPGRLAQEDVPRPDGQSAVPAARSAGGDMG